MVKKMSETELKIEEIPQQHVGKGRAIIDPKIIEDANWNTGQILELTFNKKTHVKLWPGTPEDYGTGFIKIDLFLVMISRTTSGTDILAVLISNII